MLLYFSARLVNHGTRGDWTKGKQSNNCTRGEKTTKWIPVCRMRFGKPQIMFSSERERHTEKQGELMSHGFNVFRSMNVCMRTPGLHLRSEMHDNDNPSGARGASKPFGCNDFMKTHSFCCRKVFVFIFGARGVAPMKLLIVAGCNHPGHPISSSLRTENFGDWTHFEMCAVAANVLRKATLNDDINICAFVICLECCAKKRDFNDVSNTRDKRLIERISSLET